MVQVIHFVVSLAFFPITVPIRSFVIPVALFTRRCHKITVSLILVFHETANALNTMIVFHLGKKWTSKWASNRATGVKHGQSWGDRWNPGGHGGHHWGEKWTNDQVEKWWKDTPGRPEGC